MRLFVDAQESEVAHTKDPSLPRDVGASDVLVDVGGGLSDLCDWDTSRWPNSPSLPRRSERTGTWQFMSVSLLCGNGHHGVSDDLESFFWSIIFLALRYCQIAVLNATSVQTILNELFDSSVAVNDIRKGGDKKDAFLSRGRVATINVLAALRSSLPTPISTTVMELAKLFRDLYGKDSAYISEADGQNIILESENAKARLEDHKYVESLFLAGTEHPQWTDIPNVAAEDQIAELVKQMDTLNTISRMERESASSTLSQVSVTSGTGKGSRWKRPHGSNVNDAPRKIGRGVPSPQAVSGGTRIDSAHDDDTQGAEAASNAKEEDKEEDSEGS